MNIDRSSNQICRWSSWSRWGRNGWALATSFTYYRWYVITPNLHSPSLVTLIDFPSSHLPTSPPIAPILNVGLVSLDTEMADACEISLNLFAIKMILTSFILISQLIGLKALYKELLISCNILLLSWLVHVCSKSLCSISDGAVIDPPSSGLPTSLPMPSVLNAKVMSASKYFYKYSSGLLESDRLCRVLNKPSSWHHKQHFSSKCDHRP